jgi:Na+-transporting methylmalonyl-CoA/oxaloacetate decarboxylase gamma subunit
MNILILIPAASSVNVSLTLTVVLAGLAIVFLSILVVYLLFRYVPIYILKFRFRRSGHEREARDAKAGTAKTMSSGEVNAAIAMALFMYYNEMHDHESRVITIKRVSKTYSPWSSKLYNMKNL